MASCPPQRQRQLEKLIQRLGLPGNAPIRWDLLDLALTHPSASGRANYEQLEFVGDSVVRLLAAVLLQAENAQGSVGEWSAIRSVLVSDRHLATLAANYGLDRFLLLGPSTLKDRRGQDSRLADAFEAVLGALYLSTGDLSLIQPWLQDPLRNKAEQVRIDPAYQNYKAALQQWTQAVYQQLPEYRVQETSPPSQDPSDVMADRFTAEVWLQEELLGVGKGHSIKAAEKAAAQIAFLKVQSPLAETEF
ncbi:ribonuclease III family protein [Acaryochloris marina]|uniref:Ribonuclease 3 n=1 Tax=Acaryochloris marina (strain MBIC 11017) TaxID=329726 RepID=B0CB99_ACAM1|nr:ribonuclease III domain-containing protein [Acaryochloris marina]ABW26738.1 ribonuclease III [Acaryochloris marina MBIC11017]BDM81515.1 ribonuclease 3 [Acaryochloris marina MBIC10699]